MDAQRKEWIIYLASSHFNLFLTHVILKILEFKYFSSCANAKKYRMASNEVIRARLKVLVLESSREHQGMQNSNRSSDTGMERDTRSCKVHTFVSDRKPWECL